MIPPGVDPQVWTLAQFIFDMGREVQAIAAKREAELADAIDAGYAMGYTAGQNDAGVIDTDGEPVDEPEVIVVDGTLPALMPPPDPRSN